MTGIDLKLAFCRSVKGELFNHDLRFEVRGRAGDTYGLSISYRVEVI